MSRDHRQSKDWEKLTSFYSDDDHLELSSQRCWRYKGKPSDILSLWRQAY